MRTVLTGLLLLVVAGGCAPVQPLAPSGAPPSGAPPSGPSVYLVSHGWHVGIAMEQRDVSPASWPESAAFSGFRYLELGWGDADYYPAARGTTRLALKAAFSSRGSVLHVVAFSAPLTEFFDGATIIEIPLSPLGFEGLSRFIHASL